MMANATDPLTLGSNAVKQRVGRQSVYATPVSPARKPGFNATYAITPKWESGKLTDAGKVTSSAFFDKTDRTTMSIGFTLTQAWILEYIFGTVTKATKETNKPYIYTFKKNDVPVTFTHEARVKGSLAGQVGAGINNGQDFKIVSTGCTADSFSLTSTVEESVKCTMQASSGNVDVTPAAFADFADDSNLDDFAYSFKQGSVSMGSEVIGRVYDISLDIQSGRTQDYAHGASSAVSPLPGVYDISGNLTIYLIGAKLLTYMKNRTTIDSVVITFSDGGTGADEQYIKFKLKDVRISGGKINSTGVEKLVIQDADLMALDCEIEVGSANNYTLDGTHLPAN